MTEPVFKIKSRKYTGESTVISMRIPKDMLTGIDRAAEFAGRTRNELLTMSLEFALGHMVIEKE